MSLVRFCIILIFLILLENQVLIACESQSLSYLFESVLVLIVLLLLLLLFLSIWLGLQLIYINRILEPELMLLMNYGIKVF